ncbi:alpha/beta hydrolase [Pseudoclavibacter sp. AY1F1]|uniref:alpha/beta hydrolase n=1 Tax=Pseudoclavibacter sp. AY1F1 TaxID=2080583 RepID=UPI000CE804E7|nr:alpha/beta hydrolase [Pseudoclavibacter sp. AY1F1]PPF44406.1 alpha/beta hydrolase [Pseudoclavibacter sp. AY1F1]
MSPAPRADSPAGPPRRVERDLVFSEPPGFRPLTLDLHLPVGEHPPVVLFIHGGGWFRGSRRMFCPGRSDAETFGRLAREGWAVAAIDYRLSGEATFPAPLADVEAAITWVVGDGAETFGLDASRLALWGESAGGHLAALAAAAPGTPARAVVDWYGPSDLAAIPKHAPQPGTPATPSREEMLIGGFLAEHPELTRAASPVHAVHAGVPPVLLAHGTADSMVPPQQSVLLRDALETAGAHVELQLVPGADHMWRGLDDFETVLAPALRFLDEHVRSAGDALTPPAPAVTDAPDTTRSASVSTRPSL